MVDIFKNYFYLKLNELHYFAMAILMSFYIFVIIALFNLRTGKSSILVSIQFSLKASLQLNPLLFVLLPDELELYASCLFVFGMSKLDVTVFATLMLDLV